MKDIKSKVQTAAKTVISKKPKKAPVKAQSKTVKKVEEVEEDDDDIEEVEQFEDEEESPKSNDSVFSTVQNVAIATVTEMIQHRAVGMFLFAAVAIYRYGDNMSV